MPSPYHKSGRCQWEYGEADKTEITEYRLRITEEAKAPISWLPGSPFQLHQVGAAPRAALVASGRVGTACCHRRIAVSVWRLDNSETTLAACNYPGHRSPFFTLYRVGLALRANLAASTASRGLRSRSVLWFHLSTFAQAVGRLAPLHCLPTPRPYLPSVICTPYSVL